MRGAAGSERLPGEELAYSTSDSAIGSSSTAGSGDARRGGFMQRFLTFVVLSLLTIPVGLSLQGCANKNANYCNGAGYGYLKSQPVAIILQPQTTGLSVAFSQTSQLPVSHGPKLQRRFGLGRHLYVRHHGPHHRRRFSHRRSLRRDLESPDPGRRRLHHLLAHQQDRHRVHDRERWRIYQQPGCGVFPSSDHQPHRRRPDKLRRARVPFPGRHLPA